MTLIGAPAASTSTPTIPTARAPARRSPRPPRGGLDFVVGDPVLAREHEASVAGPRPGGREVHDPAAPDVNHLLVLGADGTSPRSRAIPGAHTAQAHSGLALSFERAGRAIAGGHRLVAWDAEGYTGSDLDYMSEFKGLLSRLARDCTRAALGIRGPFPRPGPVGRALARSGVVYPPARPARTRHLDPKSAGVRLSPLPRGDRPRPRLRRVDRAPGSRCARHTRRSRRAGRRLRRPRRRAGVRFTAEDEVEDGLWDHGARLATWPRIGRRATPMRLVRHGRWSPRGGVARLRTPSGAYRAEAYLHHALRRRAGCFNPIFVRSVACPGPERPRGWLPFARQANPRPVGVCDP